MNTTALANLVSRSIAVFVMAVTMGTPFAQSQTNGAPQIRVTGTSGTMVQLSVRTASNAASSRLQRSSDLVQWVNVASISGASVDQSFQLSRSQSRQFYRVMTETTTAVGVPILIANSLATATGSTTVLGIAHLSTVDSDTAASSLIYTVSGVAGGRFERVASPGTAITSFSQADIASRAIRFVHDGTTTRPAYSISVSDGSNQTTASAASISFCDGTRTSTMTAAEMASVDNLVQLAQVTHTVVASGSWSDTTVWQGGTLPTAGARIHIPAGFAVVVDSQLAPEFETIRIDGMLRFAPNVNTRLKVDTIVSMHCGRLEIGTAAIPISDGVTAEVVFADDGPINTTVDVAQLGRGAVLHGKTVMHGKVKTPWTTLATQPATGATSLTLAQAPVGWAVGDTIVIAGTDPNNHSSDEVRTITSINGTTIGLNTALARDHIAPATGLDVHVANTTRNIKITSENSTIARRGHIMIMHSLEADIRYAGLEKLGRTNKRVPLDDTKFPELEENGSFVAGARTNIRGRYSLHFHRGGSNPTFTAAQVHGCSVVDDPGWAYVNHSARVDFVNNVSYNIVGGAYQTEAGDETGSFINNIAIRTVNVDDPMSNPAAPNALVDLREEVQDYAWQGDGFWIHGGGVAVDGNVVSGASGHAYIYWPEGLIEANLGMMRGDKTRVANSSLLNDITQFEIWWLPITSSKNNTAYSATKGLVTYYLHTSFLDDPGLPGQVVSQAYRDTLDARFEGFKIWNMRQVGMDFNYTENVTVKDTRIVGNGTANVVGLDSNHFHNLEDYTFDNVMIEGFAVGCDVPSNGRVTIRNCTMNNQIDFRVREPQFIRGDQEQLVAGAFGRTMLFENITFVSSTSTMIQMAPDFTLSAEVQDGIGDSDTGKYTLYFLLTDSITLNFGQFQNARLYFDQQAGTSTPITSANNTLPGTDVVIPAEYVNQTNAQLQSQFSSSFGGALLPGNAAAVSRIVGGKVVSTP